MKRHDGFRYVRGSAGDATLVNELTAAVDQVYHLAAAVGVRLIADDPIQSIERNIRPAEVLLDAVRVHQARGRRARVFLASSSEVYGKNPADRWDETADLVFGRTDCPRWSYGAAKAIDEFLTLAYCRQYGMPVVVGRFFNVVGPRQQGAYGMVLPRFVERALAGQPPVVHDDGKQVRCFAHVADVVETVLALMDSPSAEGGVFNIGSDQPITILELARRVISQIDPQLDVEFQSYGEAYTEDFEDVRQRVPILDRLRSTIDYRPRYDLDETIRQVIEWKRRQP